MEKDSDGETYKLVYWNYLYENTTFNRNAAEAILNRHKIETMDKSSSPVYRHRLAPLGPRRVQAIQLRLMPLHLVQETNSSKYNDNKTVINQSHSNNWIINMKGRFRVPPFQQRLSTNQIWLMRQSQTNDQYPKHICPISSAAPSPLPPIVTDSAQSDISFCMRSDTTSSTPLPIFLRRPPIDQLLFRRPTIEKGIPLPVGDELFEAFTKTIDLKQLTFKKTAESYKFYETHFPLLLTRITKEGERCVTPSKRSRTPESPMSIMIARQRALNERLVDLEYMMEVLEKETEDCLFITELHSSTFTPTKWPWNKLDVVGLRRRYTIDASLREMK